MDKCAFKVLSGLNPTENMKKLKISNISMEINYFINI